MMQFIRGALSFGKALLPSTPVLLAYGIGVLGILGIFTWWSVHQYNRGYDAAIEDIALENQGAVDAAKKAKKPVTDCFDGGGTWDPIKRVCAKG